MKGFMVIQCLNHVMSIGAKEREIAQYIFGKSKANEFFELMNNLILGLYDNTGTLLSIHILCLHIDIALCRRKS